MLKTGVTVRKDRVSDVLAAVNSLTQLKVVVGIPAENNDRDPADGDAIGNAALLYVHETGAPAANIPPRPTLSPGIKAYEPRATERFKKAAQAAIDGAVLGGSGAPINVAHVAPIIAGAGGGPAPAKGVLDQLNAIGLEAVVSVKKQFTEGDLTPLKPATLAARKARGFQGDRPLIETGDLMRHINYAIRKTK